MAWKDSLARWIKRNPNCAESYSLWDNVRAKIPSVEVKTVDAKSKVVNIRLSSSGGWIKPVEWADQHILNMKQRVHDALGRTVSMVPPDSLFSEVSKYFKGCSFIDETIVNSLNSRVDDLTKRIALMTSQLRDSERNLKDMTERYEDAHRDRFQANQRLTKIHGILEQSWMSGKKLKEIGEVLKP